MTHANLRTALAAARKAARLKPLVKTERGGKLERYRKSRTDEPEHWWYYAPTEKVMEVALEVLEEHGLEIEWLASTIGQRGQVVSRWQVVHVESGESRECLYEAPPFPDSETPTHAVLGTTRHGERAVHLLVLQIQMVESAREGETVVDGVIVRSRRTAADQIRETQRDGADEMPAWGNPDAEAGAGGGPPDPGLLGGEDPPRLCGQRGCGAAAGDTDLCETHLEEQVAEAERAELAPEADAAALGVEAVDTPALIAGLARRGARLGIPAGPERLDSAITAALARVGQQPRRVSRLTPDLRAQVVELLREEGDLP